MPKNKPTLFILCLLLLGSMIKIFYKFSERALFEYDQEYLALSAKSILIDHKPTLIGAPTSIGSIFIGPLYNYVVSAFFWLFQMHPIAVTVLTALWDPITVAVTFLVIVDLFDLRLAILTSSLLLGSFAFNNVNFNPPLVHGVPIFSLLTLWSVIRSMQKPYFLFVTAIVLGLAWQLHFNAVILATLAAFFIFLLKIKLHRKVVTFSLFVLVLFFLPTIFFDFRHGFSNIRHVFTFFPYRQQSLAYLSNLPSVTTIVLDELSFVLSYHWMLMVSKILIVFSFIFLFYALTRLPKRHQRNAFIFLLWTIAYSYFMSLYPGKILPYYLLPIEILFFVFLAITIHRAFQLFPILVIITLGFYLAVNTIYWATFTPPLTLQNKLAALRFIKTHSQDKPIYLSQTIEKGYEGGFTYLEWYLNMHYRDEHSLPIYTLVVPHDWINAALDYRSGGVGVIVPK